jgi:hypothetical protein
MIVPPFSFDYSPEGRDTKPEVRRTSFLLTAGIRKETLLA